ncbi:hypothetical protein LMG27952_05968 [Paraburkholderia hiiakae]|uniref:Uncharacterized protein n=1 Tax=Paraburkholderia hiiakae TaxID=1081782 RepID=A0ABN7I875_9BURK|nr:hypothetical protein LMG27952_05968 [Paraburkholderia hiiakae]
MMTHPRAQARAICLSTSKESSMEILDKVSENAGADTADNADPWA